jgi:hypothetical protein
VQVATARQLLGLHRHACCRLMHRTNDCPVVHVQKKEKHSIGIALRQQSRNEPEWYRALRKNTWTKLKSVVDKVKEAA